MGERRWLALDGLRGVAVLMVLADHGFGLSSQGYPTGPAGVMIFFVLSGFLITHVIADARSRGEWSLRLFLLARVVRLVPALWVMQLVVIGWWLLAGGRWTDIAGTSIATALYLQNVAAPWLADGIFTHAWSLGVEEQFYLLWPLLLPLVIRSRRPLLLLGPVIVCSIASRLLLGATGHTEAAYGSLPTNAFALLLGCALVLAPVRVRAGRPQRAVATLGLGAILVVCASGSTVAVAVIVTPVLVALIAPAVVATSLAGVPWLEVRWLRFVGRISYALYLWHWPVMILLGDEHGGLSALPAVALSFVLATASTLWLEEPLRRAWRARQAAQRELVRA